ncbi:hypothetical protein BKI52_31855 [marine bacterium AO1-C]|nr:hypothetical protein BKI52_31855 [marine bacterium AO1-C]
MKLNTLSFILMLLMCSVGVYAQKVTQKANFTAQSVYMRKIPALSNMDNIISAKNQAHKAPAKRRGKNTYIEGKGLPNKAGDKLMDKQLEYVRRQANRRTSRSVAPIANFDAHAGTVLNDPTGAIGPNHYVYAFNSGFGILDRAGNVLVPEASLATLFPGETLGDPIVVYDNFANRFIIMQFSNTPNGILIAVCQGADPVNDGWYTYRFNTGTFPDYEKLSIWSDGYYITANKDQNSAATSQVVFALERDKMLLGESAQIIGFPLPGVSTNGFYSPGGFNATGTTLPPVGVGHQIIYMQDDGWAGVDRDHLKIWTTTVDWANPTSSSISTAQELDTTPFDGVFNGGSFQNLDEPGSGPNLDAIQATMMYMTNYRRFGTHNSVVLNFVVDVSGNDTQAAIRWYELRQTADGQPWSIYQEGTYVQPDGHNAYCGSIQMDGQGNIGLGYSIVSTTVHTALRYTGRLASDPLGLMTFGENVIVDGDATENRGDGRYGDYAQLTIDPTDDLTFWHIGEYFKGPDASQVRRSRVAAFRIGSAVPDSTAPSVPTQLTASNLTYSTVQLSWQPSTDNIGVISYEVYQNGTLASIVSGTSLTVTKLTPLTTYEFTVRARDAAGNKSAFSEPLSVTTPNSPFCLNGIIAYPYTQGFEDGFGDWTPMNSKKIEWKVGSGSTPRYHTGPDSAAQGSFYAYATRKFGFGHKQSEAFLLSPCFTLNGLSNPVFSFKYHLKSFYEPGGVSLDISKDNGTTWETLWVQKGNQGDDWNTVQVNLAQYLGENIQLRFNRLAKFGSTADIAFDDIFLGEPEICLEGQLKLDITFDNFPEEVSWELRNENDSIVDFEQYTNAIPDRSSISKDFNLPDGKYTFIMRDSFGDGIFSPGGYTLSIGGKVIISESAFGSEARTSFCINNSTVSCDNGITSYPYTQGFENQLGDWTQTNSKGLRWVSIKPGDYSNPNIAPAAVEGDRYAYVHPWRGNPFFPSILTSPCFDLSEGGNPVFSFKYFMNAPFKTGTLNLEISTDNGSSWTAIWGRTGNQGPEWLSESISLNAYRGKRVQLRFVGATNTFMWANIAVDDLLLNTEGECTPGDVTLDLTFDNYPQETSWELKDDQGNIIDSASYTTATPDGSSITRTFSGLPTGNYTFTIKDSFGDGICCAFGEGSFTLSGSGGIIATGGAFGREANIVFCVQNTGTENAASRKNIKTYELNDETQNDFVVYPNPADQEINIDTKGKKVIGFDVFSMYGKSVNVIKTSETSIKIADLPVGVYFIRIYAEGQKAPVTLRFVKK